MKTHDDRQDELDDRLVRRLKAHLNRRDFLAKLSSGSLAAVVTMLGLSRPAQANVPYLCCQLCKDPVDSCTGACQWCWPCCYQALGERIDCCEYFPAGAECSGSKTACGNAICSTARPSGSGC